MELVTNESRLKGGRRSNVHCSLGLHQNLVVAGAGEVEADGKEEERPAAANTCTKKPF